MHCWLKAASNAPSDFPDSNDPPAEGRRSPGIMENPDRSSYEWIGELLLELLANGSFTVLGELIAAILSGL